MNLKKGPDISKCFKMISYGITCLELNFGDFLITDEGLENLAKSIEGMSELEILKFQFKSHFGYISNKGFQALVYGIDKSKKLMELVLHIFMKMNRISKMIRL